MHAFKDMASLHDKFDSLRSQIVGLEERQRDLQCDLSRGLAVLTSQVGAIMERLHAAPRVDDLTRPFAPHETARLTQLLADTGASVSVGASPSFESPVVGRRAASLDEVALDMENVMDSVARRLRTGMQRVRKSTAVNAHMVNDACSTLRWVQEALPDVRDRIRGFLPKHIVPVRDVELCSEILRQRAIDDAAEEIANAYVRTLHAGRPSRFMVSLDQFEQFKRHQCWMRYGPGIGNDSWDVSFMFDLQQRLQHVGMGLFSATVHMRLVTSRMPVVNDTLQYDEPPQYGDPQHEWTWCHVAPPSASLSPLRYEGHYCVDHVESFRVFISPRPPDGTNVQPWYCSAGGYHAQDLTTTVVTQHCQQNLPW